LIAPISLAQSPSYNWETLTLGTSLTNVVGASTSNLVSTAGIFYAGRAQNVGVQFSAKSTAADAGTVTLVFSKSVDGSTYDTIAAGRFTFITTIAAANATTALTDSTNWNVGGIGWIKLHSIATTCTNTLTNIVVKCSRKESAP
jgi:hypothetical protein